MRPAPWTPPLPASGASVGSLLRQFDLPHKTELQNSNWCVLCVCIELVLTIVIAVQTVEHVSQSFLMPPQILGELLEVQLAIVVDVTLQDYLVREETVRQS